MGSVKMAEVTGNVDDVERRKYELAWTDSNYRRVAHGLALWNEQPEIFPNFSRAIDIGCGHGRLFAHWRDNCGIDAWGLDIVDGLDPDVRELRGNRLIVMPLWHWRATRRFDLGVAADVMEHIPTELVPRCLENIAASCDCFIAKTAEFPSRHVGGDLHPTIKPAAWWIEQMQRIGGEVEELPTSQARGKKHLLRWWT